MAHGKDAARDLMYGRRGGGWVPSGHDDRTLAEVKADHLANPPKGCDCLFCAEARPDSPQLDLFGDDL